MELDQSTAAFYNAYVSSEVLTTVEVKCFAPNKLGAGSSGVLKCCIL